MGTPTALRSAGRRRAYAPASPNAPPAQRAGSQTPSGERSTRRRVTVTAVRPPGATPSPSSPPTSTEDLRIAANHLLPHRHRSSVHGPPAGKSPRQPVRVRSREQSARTLAEIGDPHRFADGGLPVPPTPVLAPVVLAIRTQRRRPANPEAWQPPPQKRHVHRSLRRHPARPRRPRLLPAQTLTRQNATTPP